MSISHPSHLKRLKKKEKEVNKSHDGKGEEERVQMKRGGGEKEKMKNVAGGRVVKA